jgi:hypothetical protein
VRLTPEAMQVVGEPGASERATCFISTRLFDCWHKAHPDWRVIKKGCELSHEDLIEVPEVEVAGLRSGPVWFTRRSEGNYVWMSSFMDAPISASIGGNVFRHFRLTIDYPHAVAYLEPRSAVISAVISAEQSLATRDCRRQPCRNSVDFSESEKTIGLMTLLALVSKCVSSRPRFGIGR